MNSLYEGVQKCWHTESCHLGNLNQKANTQVPSSIHPYISQDTLSLLPPAPTPRWPYTPRNIPVCSVITHLYTPSSWELRGIVSVEELMASRDLAYACRHVNRLLRPGLAKNIALSLEITCRIRKSSPLSICMMCEPMCRLANPNVLMFLILGN